MIVTRLHLLGADGKVKHVTFEGEHYKPFDFIKTTDYSDYKVVSFDVLDLGTFESTPAKILKNIQKFLAIYMAGNNDDERISSDRDWDYLFIEHIAISTERFENYLEKNQ